MHAPPGMGTVDFAALAATLAPLMRQDTRIVIEIKRNFRAHAETATLAAAQAFAARLSPAYSPNPAPLSALGGFGARDVLHPGL